MMHRAFIFMCVLLLTGCTMVVDKFLYTPTALPQSIDSWARANDASVFTVKTSDGLSLTGLHLHSGKSSKNPVLYFHGNGGNLVRAATYAKPLTARGFDVYVASYRGYSCNSGVPSEIGLMRDGQAFFDYVVKSSSSSSSTSSHLKPIVLGFSLGSSVALQLAARNDVYAAVTIGAFSRLSSVVPLGLGHSLSDRYDNIAAIGQITEPVLLVHGTRDHVIPFEQTRQLHAASRHRNVRLYRLEGADHEIDPEKFAELFDEQMTLLNGRR